MKASRMTMQKWLSPVLILLALLCLGSNCLMRTSTPAISVPDYDVLLLRDSDPSTLDPAMARETGSVGYIMQIFSGLVAFDENMNVVPDIAESWETDNTNAVYTFHLRQGVTFHDGGLVTAADFKYSWERACDPATGSQTAGTYLNDIVGATQMLEGNAEEIAGVEVEGDYTLRVTIDQPKAYFLSKLAQPVAFVVDRENVDSGQDWWREPNGTGPFELSGWELGELLLLERNDLYYRDQAKVRYVAFLFSGGYSTQMYELNQIHVTGISIYDLERVMDPTNRLHSQLAIFAQYNISYLGFNTIKAPFNDIRVRQAFCMAVDKDRVVSQVLLDSVDVARGIVPPGMIGYDAGFNGLEQDVDTAKALLAEAGYGPGGNPLKVVVTLPGSSGYVSNSLIAILWQWKENLGAEVEIRQLDGDAYFDRLDEEKDDVFFYGWSADYPDPQDFLDVLFRSGSVNNVGGYGDAAYDALLDQAAVEPDESVREALYRQAEVKLISEDAACLPLWFGVSYLLIKPRVEGYTISPLGFPLLATVSVSD
ncbi:MAG: peptide ABC transporter substrate-binding protein [Dehalococcoidia bacterium]|nr:peptide ABC transporter substrate-binding protein [Dehalococcoidia bacterium]